MRITLVGILADPQMLRAFDLAAAPLSMTGRLVSQGRAGVDRDAWPVLTPAADALDGVEVPLTDALRRYADVMGLEPVMHDGQSILGVSRIDATEPVEGAQDPALAAAIARQIRDAPADADAALLSWRLPMMGIWASSRLRAAASPPTGQGIVPLRGPEGVTVLERSQPFLGYFAAERQRLTHRLHGGGDSPPLVREAFLMGDAAVLLPWDPRRDRVLVIEQFRMAPAMRGDPQPWLLEPIAGRIDAGEDPETAILREAREEAALSVARLFPAFSYYPSPGAVGEYLYQFVGIADLPDEAAGIHGLDAEAEDIRGHVLPRSTLSALVEGGQISNGPLTMLSMWLDARADRIRGELAGDWSVRP